MPIRRPCLAALALTTACFSPADGSLGESEGSTGSGSASATTTGVTTGPSTSETTGPTTSSSVTSDGSTTEASGPTATTDGTTTTQGTATTDSTGSTGEPPLVCDDPEIPCDGACENPVTSTAHCGACGHDCLGGGCDTGACQAVELATDKGRLFMVQLVDDDIYYGGDGVDVGRIGKDGTGDIVLVPAGVAVEDREWCYDSTATATEVLWGNDWVQAHWSVRGCPTPGCAGGPIQYVADAVNIRTLVYAPTNNTLYWTQGSDFMSRVWPSGAPQVFAGAQTSIVGSTVDDQFVYWIDRQAADNVDFRKQALNGQGGIVNLALDRGNTWGSLAATSNRLFWSEDADVFSVPLPNGVGGGSPTLVGTTGVNVRGLLADESHVYFLTWTTNAGALNRCPVDGCGGGGPDVLVSGLDRPWGINQDALAVYWVTEGGSVSKIAK